MVSTMRLTSAMVKVAGNIQHQAPPFKAGIIPEGKSRHRKTLSPVRLALKIWTMLCHA